MQVWAFWHNPCIYESAAATVSLHRTKKGAWKAKNKFMWTMIEHNRELEIRHGKFKGLGSKDFQYESFGISQVEIQD